MSRSALSSTTSSLTALASTAPPGVEIFLSLYLMLDADPRVSQFIISMEEAQKKSV